MTIYASGCDGIPADKCVRSSHMKALHNRTLAHVYAEYHGAGGVETDALRLGTLTHVVTLEPAEFDRRYKVAPTASRASNDGVDTLIAWYQATLAEFGIETPPVPDGKIAVRKAYLDTIELMVPSSVTICDEAEFIEAAEIYAAVRSCPKACEILTHPRLVTEQHVVWVDESGEWCQGKIDILIPPDTDANAFDGDPYPDGLVADLKTCKDGSPRGFRKAVDDGCLHWQADFYQRAFAALYGHRPTFLWIAAEKTKPVKVAIYRATDRLTDLARLEYAPLLGTLSSAIQSNNWPGYSGEIVDIEPMEWKMRRLENE